MGEADWRSDERYAAVNEFSPAELAWEFLRRNPDYQQDFRTWNEVASGGTSRVDDARWARWGLTFPGGPEALRARPASLLAA